MATINAAPARSQSSAFKRLRLPLFPFRLRLSQLIWLMVPSAVIGATISILGVAVDRFLTSAERPILLSDYLQGLAAALLFYVVALYYSAYQQALVAQLKMVAEVNHHVRNALAAMTFAAHLSQSRELVDVNQKAVSRIEWALREVLPDPLRRPEAEQRIISRPVLSVFLWTLGVVIVLGLLDYLTSHEITLLFYLLPVSLAAWYGGQPAGFATAMLSAAVSVVANQVAGMPYSQPQTLYWYGFLKLCLFMCAAFVLAALHAAFGMRKELSRIENLLTTIAKPAPDVGTSSATAESSRGSPGNRKAG
jgi:hypothetical protein